MSGSSLSPVPGLPVVPGSPEDPAARELLQSVVDVARAIFGAAASSVCLLDEETDELVFRAVAGQGEEFLVGRRFPAGSGIAGWVVASGEPMVVDDLAGSTAFDREIAASTEYVPDSLMAAPLITGDRVLGVLEVLDASPQSRTQLSELHLLTMFAHQAAAALRVIVDHHARARPRPGLSPGTRASALRLLDELQHLLEE